MRKYILWWKRTAFFFIFLALFAGVIYCVPTAAQQTDDVDRVLFISSYSYAWEAVPPQMEGIKEALGEDVVLDYQFMDTKNIDTEESGRLFYESIKYYLQQVPPYDVIIVGDDAAFNFALEYQQELFAGIPIIFEGVNNVEKAVTANEDPYITGVIESLSYGDTIALASKMYPQATQVVAILDDTVTGEGERVEFFKYDAEFPELEFKEINASVLSQEELKRQVAALGEESILVYIMCSEDGDGNTYASAEAVTMLSDSAQIPTFSIVSIGMGKGFLGGEIVSQKEMGSIAGNMAMRILQGEACSDISLVEDSPKTYCFDENVMNRFGIERSDLPENVEIINHKETFVERNKSMIQIALVVGSLLIFIIALLAADNMRRRRMNEVIRRANAELERTARFDPLTQIYNRRTFMEDLQEMMEAGEPFGIIMYDLDNFKSINDIYGHNTGDWVLKELAARSKSLADDLFTVYRLAGDEFTAIISSGDRNVVESYGRALQKVLQQSYQLGESDVNLCASIGMAMWPEDGLVENELIAAADEAMYHIKRNGKNGIAFYTKER